ncbi:MAG: NAD(P)/FAD-dependent oxidoreductase [Gemmatimonadales bacterium]
MGAGPAGLAAAIELARHDAVVTVYEQHLEVGARFHGDFQGLENWTTPEDVLAWLEGLGLSLGCPYRPTDTVTLVDPSLQTWCVRADRPLLYLVRRGSEAGSLDRCLRRQAEAAGARILFGTRIDPRELSGTVIVATGPCDSQAVVAGIVADTPYPDQVVAIARDALAPKCYAYCVIWNGRATVASALARDFQAAWECFERARAAFAEIGLGDFRRERRFGGRAHICLGRPLEYQGRLYVGEAGGLQDYLLGFGLRYALLSGHLAARAILTGESYRELARRHLGDGFRAGFVNRLLYDHLGNSGYRGLIRWVGRASDVRTRARRAYSLTLLHRVFLPLAEGLASRGGGSLSGRRHS